MVPHHDIGSLNDLNAPSLAGIYAFLLPTMPSCPGIQGRVILECSPSSFSSLSANLVLGFCIGIVSDFVLTQSCYTVSQ